MGSLFISYPVGLIRGIDITKAGTGQLGGSNAGRLLGWPFLLISGLFDVLKSFFSLLLFEYLNNTFFPGNQLVNEISLIAGGVGLILGHTYCLYVKLYSKKWEGGKGVAPYGGILFFISWPSFIVIFIVLFGSLQALKKILKTKLSVYDNFLPNAVILLLSPIIVYIFRPELWITVWLICMIIVMFIDDRDKAFAILKQAIGK